MRIGTVALGRVGGIGDDECPTGYFLDPETGAVCLPINEQTTSTLPFDPVPFNPGVPVIPPSGSVPTINGTPTQPAPYTSLPVGLPAQFNPPGVQPGVGLSTPVTCPQGWVAQGGVCVQKATIIPGVPDIITYAGLGFLALMSLGGGGRRR